MAWGYWYSHNICFYWNSRNIFFTNKKIIIGKKVNNPFYDFFDYFRGIVNACPTPYRNKEEKLKMELIIIIGIILVFILLAVRTTNEKANNGTMTKKMSDMTNKILKK